MLKTSLLEGLFDPRNPGPMGIIVDTADPHYLMRRSIELINSALITGNVDDINKAIALLGLSKLL